MTRRIRLRLVLLALAVVTALAVYAAGVVQRQTARDETARLDASAELLASMLRMEAGASTYVLSGDDHDLHLIEEGRTELTRTIKLARRAAGDDATALTAIDTMAESVAEWEEIAQRQVALRRRGRTPAADPLEQRHLLVDVFTQANARLEARIRDIAGSERTRATLLMVLLSLFVSLGVGGAGIWMLGRRDRQEGRRRQREQAVRQEQAAFAETMQLVESEEEAYDLLGRHLEHVLPASRVAVLRRNNSANRLDAAAGLQDDELEATLQDAQPRSCVAIRLGRLHERAPGEHHLLDCSLCGACDVATSCVPMLVGGEVIGSVLARHDEAVDEPGRRRIAESVTQAAPVLGNLRTLAIAETRAATDALTGLPNRRAFQDTLRRMLAQAGRSLESLGAISLDLDHFKQVNDRFGHEKGDDVLAAVGRLLAEAVREGDFAARTGGEEFCVLLPATGRDGALELAEKLRVAVARIDVPGMDLRVTASFGVAAYPEDAIDSETLLRKADRALYLAKDRGRNRVEALEPVAASDEADPVAAGLS